MSDKLKFTDIVCPANVHCEHCRAETDGKPFRQNHVGRFELPQAPTDADPADFDCPFGKPWGYVQPPKPAGYVRMVISAVKAAFGGRCTDEATAARVTICRACTENVNDNCRLCGCKAGIEQKARQKGAECPLGKWAV